MSIDNEEKVVDEVKSPTPNEETVEAAKQILADVLTKAVDAIKETSLSASPCEDDSFYKFNPKKIIMDDMFVDFVIRCRYQDDLVLLGENSAFAKSMQTAIGFETEQAALNYIEKVKERNTLPITEPEVLMRTMKYQLNEIGHGE